MAPTGPVSRKAKRKNERDEKKRSRNKRQRSNDEPGTAAASANKSSKPRDGGGNNRNKRPQTAGQHKPHANRIQNKFHELLQETTGLSSTLRNDLFPCLFVLRTAVANLVCWLFVCCCSEARDGGAES